MENENAVMPTTLPNELGTPTTVPAVFAVASVSRPEVRSKEVAQARDTHCDVREGPTHSCFPPTPSLRRFKRLVIAHHSRRNVARKRHHLEILRWDAW